MTENYSRLGIKAVKSTENWKTQDKYNFKQIMTENHSGLGNKAVKNI